MIEFKVGRLYEKMRRLKSISDTISKQMGIGQDYSSLAKESFKLIADMYEVVSDLSIEIEEKNGEWDE